MKSNKGNFKIPSFLTNKEYYYQVFYNADLHIRYNLKLHKKFGVKGYIEINGRSMRIDLSTHAVHFKL